MTQSNFPNGMDTSNLEQQYVAGQFRSNYPELFRRHEARSATAREQDGWQWDLVYGEHPRARFDLRRCTGPAKGLVVYFHAGYWQSRDKSQFHFLAPAFNEAGFDVALVNYPLCPDATIAQILDTIAKAPAAAMAALYQGTVQQPLFLAGHSAGAHLAVELALRTGLGSTDSPRAAGLLLISGLFELRPLCDTSLNAKLGLSAAEAVGHSPLQRIVGGLPPACLAVGAEETFEFRRQTREMAMAWAAWDNPSQHITVADADHFSVLDALVAPNGALRAALDALHREACG